MIIPQCALCILTRDEGRTAITTVHGTKLCKEHVRLAMELTYGKSFINNSFPVPEETNG